MTMRSKQSPRCIRCRMHASLCLCEAIPTFDLSTRVVLVMHNLERAKTSATGPLALRCLANSELRVHGRKDRPLDLTALFTEERRVLSLFPTEGAPLLCAEFLAKDKRPVTLVVPDGNWGQALQMMRRIPGLPAAENVRLPMGERSRWTLRRQFREDGLSTFEAVARAVGIIESKAAEAAMEALFERMVKTVEKARGPRRG